MAYPDLYTFPFFLPSLESSSIELNQRRSEAQTRMSRDKSYNLVKTR